MKNRVFVLFLIMAFLLAICIPSYAATRGKVVSPELSFTGTTANCSVTITEIGKYIDATLTLKHGNSVVASWYGNGTTYVPISGTANVVSGWTYTLVVTGTIGGAEINCNPVTAICP